MGDFAAGLANLDEVDILPYHNIAAEKYRRLDRDYQLPDTQVPSKDRMAEIAQALCEFGLNVKF